MKDTWFIPFWEDFLERVLLSKISSDTLEEWDDYFVKLAPRFTLNLAMGVIYFLGHANCCTNFAFSN